MGLRISFGLSVTTIEDGEEYTHCEWPGKGIKEIDGVWQYVGKEDDGTNPNLSDDFGTPTRSMRYSDSARWREQVPQVSKFFDRFENDSYGEIPITDRVMRIIKGIPLSGSDLNIDRAIWLKYWSIRSQAEFGYEAHIFFR